MIYNLTWQAFTLLVQITPNPLTRDRLANRLNAIALSSNSGGALYQGEWDAPSLADSAYIYFRRMLD